MTTYHLTKVEPNFLFLRSENTAELLLQLGKLWLDYGGLLLPN